MTHLFRGVVAATFFFAALLINVSGSDRVSFEFNEGTGPIFRDSSGQIEGRLGYPQNPDTDESLIETNSPSGLSGDLSVRTRGDGYLLGEDTNGVLKIGHEPLTVEAWVNLNEAAPRSSNPVIGYGHSYKLLILQGRLVWGTGHWMQTTNRTFSGITPGNWVHVAAAWKPGVGVTFYLNGAESFQSYTNLVSEYRDAFLRVGAAEFHGTASASFDRVRIHRAFLNGPDLDSVRLSPRPPTPFTVASYNFDRLPCPPEQLSAPSLHSSVQLLPVVSGPAWDTDTPSRRPGDFALRFGAGDMTLAYDPLRVIARNESNGNYTIEAWVKLPKGFATEITAPIVEYRGVPWIDLGLGWDLTIRDSGGARFPSDEKWHHVAMVVQEGVSRRTYIDGILSGETSARATPFLGGKPTLTIGSFPIPGTFLGSIDRVRYSNYLVSTNGLDFHPDDRFPRILREPEDIVADVRTATAITAEMGAEPASPLKCQWFYSATERHITAQPIPGANSPTLSFSEVKASDTGYYSVEVSNELGLVRSRTVKLLVVTEPALLTEFWSLQPNERTYVQTNQQGGMSYNPATDHLHFSRDLRGRGINGLNIVDSQTGEEIGYLKTNGIVTTSGLAMSKSAVAQDGAVFAAMHSSFGNPLTVFRWLTELSPTEVIYSGTPPAGVSASLRSHVAVTGAGPTTKLLIETSSGHVALLSATSAAAFTMTFIESGAGRDGFAGGLAFASSSTFYGKALRGPLKKWQIDLTTKKAHELKVYPLVSENLANLAIHPNGPLLAGIEMREGEDQLQLYRLNDSTGHATLLDTVNFKTNQANFQGLGSVAFAKGRLYAVNTFNGLLALRLPASIEAPTIRIFKSGATPQLNWWAPEGTYTIERAASLNGAEWVPFSEPASAETGATVNLGDTSGFFRLRKAAQ